MVIICLYGEEKLLPSVTSKRASGSRRSLYYLRIVGVWKDGSLSETSFWVSMLDRRITTKTEVNETKRSLDVVREGIRFSLCYMYVCIYIYIYIYTPSRGRLSGFEVSKVLWRVFPWKNAANWRKVPDSEDQETRFTRNCNTFSISVTEILLETKLKDSSSDFHSPAWSLNLYLWYTSYLFMYFFFLTNCKQAIQHIYKISGGNADRAVHVVNTNEALPL